MTTPAPRLDRPLKETDPEVYDAIVRETRRQAETLELIASENFTSEAVLEATGSVFTNKYAEGYPGRRYYGGCQFADVVESLARERAKKLFGAEHANVQPHSGTQANIAVYETLLKEADPVLGMNLSHGGHLSHGHPLNFSGKHYKFIPYGVRRDTETIDYDELEKLAHDGVVDFGVGFFERAVERLGGGSFHLARERAGGRSSSVILSMRRWWRPPPNLVFSHSLTMATAWLASTTRAPMQSTLALVCSAAMRAL